MVAPFFRLRLSILANTLRRPARSRFAVVLWLLLAVAAAVGSVWGLGLLAGDDTVLLGRLDVVSGGLLLALSALVPFFANERLLEPKQFSAAPVPPRTVALGLAVSSLASLPAILFVIWLGSHAVFRESWRAAPGVAVAAGIGALALTVLLVRTASALSKLWFTTPRARDVRGTIGVIVVLSALPLSFFLFTSGAGNAMERSTAELARALEWTPFGAPFAAVNAAAAGDLPGALGRLGVLAAGLLLLALLWGALVAASLRRVDRPVAQGLAKTGLGWFDRFSARPSGLIGARMVTYWIRDPRYRVSLAAIPFAPVGMVLALWVAGMDWAALALVPLPVICFLLAWSIHNDVATDSTAIWSHVASGTRGRDDRFGRLIPVLMLGLPIVLIGSSITVALMGDWRALPAVIGLSAGVLLVGCGVASVSSALAPYPTTRPGDSPFVQPQWSGSGSGAAQVLSVLATVLLSLPIAILAVHAITDLSLGLQLAALALGLGLGAVVLFAGVLLGGRLFDRRGPEILALSQIFD